MIAKALMIQGTTSDAGKSTIALGICRLLRRAGKRVAPFKPQNMALNSAVTVDGGEIGRAQALQAVACAIEPHSDMNPVLLKPGSDSRAQVIVQGRVWKDLDARAYHQSKKTILPYALQSFQRLSEQFDCIVVEGAGSPAEINLREHDVANMGFACAADIPVIIVSDIDRGGVFAHLYGTFELLARDEQNRVVGFLINKFRGDSSLLASGIDWLSEKTGKPVLGVVPYLSDLVLEAEDSVGRRGSRSSGPSDRQQLHVVVPELPRLSNSSDFEPLLSDPFVNLNYLKDPDRAEACDLLILPGTKSVISDLAWLREKNWHTYIMRHLRLGGRLLGICGGFQMLGESICDPLELESGVREAAGLSLLEMETVIGRQKRLTLRSGYLTALDGAPVRGYEIHMGVSHGAALDRPSLMLDNGCDGAVNDDMSIIGTYLHGLFDTSESRSAIYKWCGIDRSACEDFSVLRERSIDRVADTLEQHADWNAISSYFCD